VHVVRKQHPNGVSFKTYDGWTHCSTRPKDVLDLNEVMRFTKGEATHPLPAGQEWVYFGCYKDLKDD
jgi:hypothetical protein